MARHERSAATWSSASCSAPHSSAFIALRASSRSRVSTRTAGDGESILSIARLSRGDPGSGAHAVESYEERHMDEERDPKAAERTDEQPEDLDVANEDAEAVKG